jgi:hypothetical protein
MTGDATQRQVTPLLRGKRRIVMLTARMGNVDGR